MEEKVKNYIDTEFGKIPSDWRYCTFKDVIVTFSSGATPYRAIAEYYKGKIRWISSGELNYNVIEDTLEHISEAAIKNTNLKIHEVGTFLMAITGLEAEGTRGRCAIIGAPSTTNQSCLALNGTGKMTTDYLFWFYRQYGNYLAFKYCQGTKQQSYTAAIVKKLPICCPKDPNEQTAIATALSDTDALIVMLDKEIVKKQQIKQGAMQQLLTGKKRLAGFGGEWVEKKLCQIALNIKTGKRNGEDNDLNGKYPFFIRSKTVLRLNSYSFNGEAILIPGEGGIGTIFHYINGKFDYHQRVYKISNFIDESDGKFIFYYMKYFFGSYALQNSVKATVDSLRLATFEEFTLIIPDSKSEQTAIAQILTDMDNEIARLEKERDKYKELKAGMMQVLLTGKVRLVNQKTISVSDQESKIIELNSSQSKIKKHTKEFDEAVIISFLVDKFGTEKNPLSRFLYTKYSYLLHRKNNRSIDDFQKFAAGPYNPKSRYNGPEKIGHENRYFKQLKNKEGFDAFIPDKSIQCALAYFDQWYGHDIQLWIEQFRNTAPWDLETLTTVDMAVVDLEKKNIEISVKNIKTYLASIPKWKAKLSKPQFADSKIQKAINKSKELFP
jgi:type I restriction enzyme S subunit